MSDIKSFTTDLLAHLGIEGEVICEEDENSHETRVQIKVAEEDSGILIGHHGEVVASLQKIFNTVFRQGQEDNRVTVNVNDYLEQRQEHLRQMALKYAHKAIQTGVSQVLPYLAANERLIVHMALKDHERVVTESEGEGMMRRLVVKIKS